MFWLFFSQDYDELQILLETEFKLLHGIFNLLLLIILESYKMMLSSLTMKFNWSC